MHVLARTREPCSHAVQLCCAFPRQFHCLKGTQLGPPTPWVALLFPHIALYMGEEGHALCHHRAPDSEGAAKKVGDNI